MVKVRVLALAVLGMALLAPKTYGNYYTVQLTTPASSEWTEDTYGGIWNANVVDYNDDSSLNASHTGLIMCTGDYHDIYIGTVTGPYTALNLLAATPTQIANDPGNYQFEPGFSLGSRTPDVQAKVSFLVDQLNNVVAAPADGNYHGLSIDDWTECKGDALVGAIHYLWDGATFTPENEPWEPLEAATKTLEYDEYMAAVAGVDASNYTSTQAIWLQNPNAQVLFANLSSETPGDPIVVPEPASVSLLVLGGLALCRRGRR